VGMCVSNVSHLCVWVLARKLWRRYDVFWVQVGAREDLAPLSYRVIES
jgi:hypothetical protein